MAPMQHSAHIGRRPPCRFAVWGCVLAFSSLGACSGEIETAAVSRDCPECTSASPPGASPPGGDAGPSRTDGSVTGAGNPHSPDGVGWATRFPKLSNRQWEATVQALFYLDEPTGYATEFTQEPLDKSYENLAAAELTVGGDAWARYQSAAEKTAARVTSDDALLAKIFPTGSGELQDLAATFVDNFGRRAYRRPLSTTEQAAYTSLFAQGPRLVGGDAKKAGAQLVIEAMLQSPYFLYRVEQAGLDGASSTPKVPLSGYELATRLSYALWDSMPSDALLDAAEAGELDSESGVSAWAKKLLDDPRARQVLVSFHAQTFAIAAYGSQDKDPSLGFDASALAPYIRDEATRFFEHVVDNRGGIADILTEPVGFVNEDTAPFYGLDGIRGKELQRVELDPDERAGLLTQLGFLSKNATRMGSDPVHRGLLVLRKILCDEPDPPPMTFQLPQLEPGLTTREVYEKATACGVGCHDTLINPPGFAFEVFDAVGRVRAREQDKPIDASGSLDLRVGYTSQEKRDTPPLVVDFDGAVELMHKLSEAERVHECYARHWMTYMLGHEVDGVERGAGEQLRASSMEEGSLRALIRELVRLDTFRYRITELPP